ncbi:hypothetical protein P152DRAFT_516122 [Eremomyces bilateralis CBS 781.70]|uniref:Uncharacterized protein n=1 Tax=Eremomyces bilateralis CBS 781.70 TaxID=1392243 RepID=A0A6G1FWH4_9PEZI|nr:uncharacterized protein P152DRAFT_516122 [Eremomyces bilateralis CBS 781.70]KAF1810245.1 hypothetical protein P152DRAFT_516122 [Eremomyces bilateralis CBS 781.70]
MDRFQKLNRPANDHRFDSPAPKMSTVFLTGLSHQTPATSLPKSERKYRPIKPSDFEDNGGPITLTDFGIGTQNPIPIRSERCRVARTARQAQKKTTAKPKRSQLDIELPPFPDLPQRKPVPSRETHLKEVETVFRGPIPGPEILPYMTGNAVGELTLVLQPNGDVEAHAWLGHQWLVAGKYSYEKQSIDGILRQIVLQEEFLQPVVYETLNHFRVVCMQFEAAVVNGRDHLVPASVAVSCGPRSGGRNWNGHSDANGHYTVGYGQVASQYRRHGAYIANPILPNRQSATLSMDGQIAGNPASFYPCKVAHQDDPFVYARSEIGAVKHSGSAFTLVDGPACREGSSERVNFHELGRPVNDGKTESQFHRVVLSQFTAPDDNNNANVYTPCASPPTTTKGNVISEVAKSLPSETRKNEVKSPKHLTVDINAAREYTGKSRTETATAILTCARTENNTIHDLFTPNRTIMTPAHSGPRGHPIMPPSLSNDELIAESKKYTLETRIKLGVDDEEDARHAQTHRKKFMPNGGKYSGGSQAYGLYEPRRRVLVAMKPSHADAPASGAALGHRELNPSAAGSTNFTAADINANTAARVFYRNASPTTPDFAYTDEGVSTIGSILLAINENMRAYTAPADAGSQEMARDCSNSDVDTHPTWKNGKRIFRGRKTKTTGPTEGEPWPTTSFYANQPRNYFAPFAKSPEWTIDRSKDGNRSYFGDQGWEKVPERVGRDRRYQWGESNFRRTNMW